MFYIPFNSTLSLLIGACLGFYPTHVAPACIIESQIQPLR